MSDGRSDRVDGPGWWLRIGTPFALFAVSGALYLARALMDLGSPVYYDPSTLLDYSAVVTTTLAMLALAAALARLAITPLIGGSARRLVWVPSSALAVGGIANLLEDAFGMDALGFVFGIGNLLTLVGLVLVSVSALRDRRNDRAIGWVLLFLAAAFLLPDFGRTAGVGILCLAVAYTLLNRRAKEVTMVHAKIEKATP